MLYGWEGNPIGLASHMHGHASQTQWYPSTGSMACERDIDTLHWSTTASLPMQCFRMSLSLSAPNLVNVLHECHQNYSHQLLDF